LYTLFGKDEKGRYIAETDADKKARPTYKTIKNNFKLVKAFLKCK
jgi:hypothetical protein